MEKEIITPPNEGKKTCKCCGRELPIEQFSMRGLGRDSMCKDCMSNRRKNSNKTKKTVVELQQQVEESKKLRLSGFTPRELMEELKRRGYEGKLTYTRIETIDLSNF